MQENRRGVLFWACGTTVLVRKTQFIQLFPAHRGVIQIFQIIMICWIAFYEAHLLCSQNLNAEKLPKKRGISIYWYVYILFSRSHSLSLSLSLTLAPSLTLSLFLSLHIYINTHIHMYICIHVFVCIKMNVRTHTHTHTHTHIYICTYLYKYKHIKRSRAVSHSSISYSPPPIWAFLWCATSSDFSASSLHQNFHFSLCDI